MDNYIGCKIIQAKLSNLQEYKIKKYGVNAIISETDKAIEGYIILYPPIGNSHADLYVSWSPKEVFEVAYRKIDNTEINLIKGLLSHE